MRSSLAPFCLRRSGRAGAPSQWGLLDPILARLLSHAAGGHHSTAPRPGRCHVAAVVLAWHAMDFIYLAGFNQPCCGQKDKSGGSFSFFRISREEKVRSEAASYAVCAVPAETM